MRKLGDYLYIGSHVDVYNVLDTFDDPRDCPVRAVLDCTSELTSRKWYRIKRVKLRKISIKPGSGLLAAQIDRAIDFIKEQHRNNEPVLVASKNEDERAVAICALYLAVHKGLSWPVAKEKVGIIHSTRVLNSLIEQSAARYLKKRLPRTESDIAAGTIATEH